MTSNEFRSQSAGNRKRLTRITVSEVLPCAFEKQANVAAFPWGRLLECREREKVPWERFGGTALDCRVWAAGGAAEMGCLLGTCMISANYLIVRTR